MRHSDVQHLIENAGHTELKDIQSKALEAIQEHNEILLFSKTGSGKTLAFLLSIIAKLNQDENNLQAIVIVPSRELCLQIADVFKSLKSNFRAVVCYGGHSIKSEENSLLGGPDIVIGTPGRIVDHIHRGNLELSETSFLTIDEFDKCLEFGFNEEMEFIADKMEQRKFLILCSATKMDEIPEYLKIYNPQTIDALKENDSIKLSEFLVPYEKNIIETLSNLINSFKGDRTIVFCNYREVTEDVAVKLQDKGITCIFYHGGMEQDERERSLIKFRTGSSNILICTDLGSRGLDIPEVMHVVHYQYPSSEDAFTHRIGRTARMDAKGNSYLFQGTETILPEYISEPTQKIHLERKSEKPTTPEWTTIYFSGGKKDKINKIDIVGFLCKKGHLNPKDIGVITLQDRAAFVGVKSNKVKQLLQKVHKEKIKGKRLKIAIAK